MDDLAAVSVRMATDCDEFVVRRFSPTRIERMLLTRLFDLTTASVSDGGQGQPFDDLAGSLSATSSDVFRKEAA